ncbi:hypothetical protein PFISCL1PPCAC_12501, partial [Pristionchus fissidentatus]
VISNTGHDAMHDILEGCARIEIKRVLTHLHDQGIRNEQVDNLLQSFSYGRNDRSAKPSKVVLTRG